MGDVIAVIIPVVAIVGAMGIGALKLLIEHREKLARMRAEQAEREAERDRELLGLGGGLGNAHLEAVLARLASLEERLAAMEQRGTPGIVAAATGHPREREAGAEASFHDEAREVLRVRSDQTG